MKWTEEIVERVARDAVADVRTVRKFATGGKVSGAVGGRIAAVVERIGRESAGECEPRTGERQ
jgi:GTP1/Obg family GTP-binding protein